MTTLGPLLLAGLALAIAALAFFAWLAEEMLEGETQTFDDTVRSFIYGFASPALTSIMRAVTLLGSTKFMVALGVGVALSFLLAGWRRAATLFAVTMAGAVLLLVTLKLGFQRARPTPFFGTLSPDSYSFPSGHALYSFCFYGVLAALTNERLRNRAARLVIWIATALLVALIGLSRIYLGVHYPSDVIAGYAAALVWVVTVAFGDHMLRGRKQTLTTHAR